MNNRAYLLFYCSKEKPMSFNRFVQFGIISSVALGVIVSGHAVIASTTTQNPALFNSRMADSMQLVAQNSGVVAQNSGAIASGAFMAAEAPTTGIARIVSENGHRYLELDSAFSTTDQAPDLHVLLDTTATPPNSYTSFGSYINLGSLQQVNGAQRYPIPDVINLDNYQSVVIWCRMANATIGYASLN